MERYRTYFKYLSGTAFYLNFYYAVIMHIGVGRGGGARGGQAPPPIIWEGGGATYPLAPPIIHPPFPLISVWNSKKSQMYQVEG